MISTARRASMFGRPDGEKHPEWRELPRCQVETIAEQRRRELDQQGIAPTLPAEEWKRGYVDGVMGIDVM